MRVPSWGCGVAAFDQFGHHARLDRETRCGCFRTAIPAARQGLGRSKMVWPECAGSFVKVVEPFGSLAPPNLGFCKIRALPCEI